MRGIINEFCSLNNGHLATQPDIFCNRPQLASAKWLVFSSTPHATPLTKLTRVAAPIILQQIFSDPTRRSILLEPITLVTMSEAALRVILGWRMLVSGISNVRRWPNPANTASILFPKGATFFGFVATFLMVVGGFGLAAGIQTPICAVMIMIFLIPTFALHWHWLKVLPTMSPAVTAAITDNKAQNYFRSFDRQAFHAHEVGIRDNLVFLAAAIYFVVRGSAAFGLDNWLPNWVIWLF
jgi:uncharacterized membrane protein YphA (DoxX/SURF4 family)